MRGKEGVYRWFLFRYYPLRDCEHLPCPALIYGPRFTVPTRPPTLYLKAYQSIAEARRSRAAYFDFITMPITPTLG
jgi:hypothetical protein